MPYYRVTFEGYIEGDYPDQKAAEQALIDQIENDELDGYGRDWRQLVQAENLDEKP